MVGWNLYSQLTGKAAATCVTSIVKHNAERCCWRKQPINKLVRKDLIAITGGSYDVLSGNKD